MRSVVADLAGASSAELVGVVEAIAGELAGRAAPQSGVAAMELAESLGRCVDVSEAALATLVARVDATGAYQESGFSSPAAWLRTALGMRHGRAAERVTAAKQLPRLERVGKLLADRRLSWGYASAICQAVPRLDDQQAQVAEDILLGMAQEGLTVQQVTKAGDTITDLIAEREGTDPEPPEARRGFSRSWFQRSRSLDQGSWFKGWLNPEHTAMFDHIIGPLAKPRARGDDRDLAQRTADALFSVLSEGNKGAGLTLVMDLAAYMEATGDTGPWQPPPPGAQDTGSTTSASGTSASATSASDASASGTSASGTSAFRNSVSHTSASGTSASGTSASDASASGTSASGTSASGTSASATSASHASDSGASASGNSASGNSVSDTSASGTSASGATASGASASEASASGQSPAYEMQRKPEASGAEPLRAPGTRVAETATRPWSGRGPARLLNGAPVSAQDARRIALNAGISPLLLGRYGLPLYLGRTVRFVTPAQRKGLLALYETCVVHGCQIPAHLCEIHHLGGGWKLGTPTDIDQLAPACGWHNRWIDHHPGQITHTTDTRGRAVLRIQPLWKTSTEPRGPSRARHQATTGNRQPGAP